MIATVVKQMRGHTICRWRWVRVGDELVNAGESTFVTPNRCTQSPSGIIERAGHMVSPPVLDAEGQSQLIPQCPSTT